MTNHIDNLEIVIRNTEILTEFTELTRRIENLVTNLPNIKDYQKDHDYIKEELITLQNNVSKILLMYNNALSSSQNTDSKLGSLPIILNSVNDIDSNTKNTPEYYNSVHQLLAKLNDDVDSLNTWAKIKFPFVIGLINLLLYAIGFYITSKKITP